MKKFKLLLVLFVSLFLFNSSVLAATATMSVDSTSVVVGKTFKVTVNMKDAASWNIHVSSTGPVSNCSIAQADTTADAKDTSKTFTATCTATGKGEITVTLSGDVTSETDGKAVKLSGSAKVNAIESSSTTNNGGSSSNNNNVTENPKTGNTIVIAIVTLIMIIAMVMLLYYQKKRISD